MKIICDRKILSSKLGIVKKAINGKNSMEILRGVLVRACDSTVTLIGYNLELGIKLNMKAKVECEGEMLIDCSFLLDLTKKLESDEVTIESLGDTAKITSNRSVYKYSIFNASDYPVLPELETSNSISIKIGLLKDMVSKTSMAVSQDQTKPILMGQLIEFDSDLISMVALDGYRLAVKRSIGENTNLKEQVNIPAKTLLDIVSLTQDENSIAQLSYDEKYLLFKQEDLTAISRIIGKSFIDYRKFVPKNFETKVKLNTSDFKSAIERASIFAQARKNSLLKLEINDSNLLISSGEDKGDCLEMLDIDMQGSPLVISFNSRYILEGLKGIDTKEFFIEFLGNKNPAVFKPTSTEDYFYLLLPILTR